MSMEKRAHVALAVFSKWMDEKVIPYASATHPLKLAEWRKEFDLIRGLVDRPDRVRIALIGSTGAGKSTFLNAVLGQEMLVLLPRGVAGGTQRFCGVPHSR
jgi:predicted GTPase